VALSPPLPIDQFHDAPDLPRLSVTFTFEGSRCELWLAGRLDAFSLVALRAQVDQFSVEPFEELVVHLQELETLDETGAAALTSLRLLVEEQGARLRLDGIEGPIPEYVSGSATGTGDDRRQADPTSPLSADRLVRAAYDRVTRYRGRRGRSLTGGPRRQQR
jgi:anti-anti-sigma regulatory factor